MWIARVVHTQSMKTWGICYIDEVSCLDYSLEVPISWTYLYSSYNCFCHLCISYHLKPHSCSNVFAHDSIFNACPWFKFFDTRVLVSAHHLAFITPLVGEFWLPWICMSRSRSLEFVDSLGCWSEWHKRCVNHRQTVQSPFLSGPMPEFFFYNSWALFVLFIIIYLFIFSHLRLSVM